MKVLVTGGAGYIGSTMVRMFLENNHEVTVLDRFFFGEESLKEIWNHPRLRIVKGDTRTVDPKIMKDIEVVIDLAALSNDPAGELNPTRTWDINYFGRARMAFFAKRQGVKRYIQASSCSIYGQQEQLSRETSPINPLTTYAKAHREMEKYCLSLADDTFCVTVLRQATVYGLSYRMRFDLAINGMVAAMYERGKQGVMRDGTQWRPFVHVKDTSKAFLMIATEEDTSKINSEIFNVGSNEQNYQIADLAKEIREAMPKEFEWEWYGDPDKRSYRVDFTKIKDTLDFTVDHKPKDAARNVYSALETGKVQKTLKTLTVKWYQKLLEIEELMRSVSLENELL
ncbi:MAG: NAD-dependent epimerase/dehydratase family protein [Candidatus Ranarchaeia archaeon]